MLNNCCLLPLLFDGLSEKVLTFVKMWLFLRMKNILDLSKTFFFENARHVHNILRLLDGWASFSFTTNETKHDSIYFFISQTQIYTIKKCKFKFKQKICLQVACRKPKYVLLPGTFKHRHHVGDKLLITFVWSPSGKYALQWSLLFKFKTDDYNLKYSVLDIN